MNRLLRILLIAAVLLITSPAMASIWTIDPDHSHIQFKIRHLTIANVKGVFGKVKGVIRIDEKRISESAVNVTIEIDSIDTGVAKRDDHLKSADFFDAAAYPTMTFVSRKVTPDGKGKLKVMGTLTLRGVSKDIVLDVEGPTPEIKDPWGGIRRGASASTKINRTDFGISWNKTLETGVVMIDDTVFITLEIEMIKEQNQ